MVKIKDIYTRETIRVYKDFTIGGNSSPFSRLADMITLRKGLLFELHRIGKGDLIGITQNAAIFVSLL